MNYSTPGISGFYMRPQGASNIGQTGVLSNGASLVGCGILGNESYRASYVGIPYSNGNRHGDVNANYNGNGYDYHYGYGKGSGNPSSNGSHDGGSGFFLNRSMVSASLSSYLAQQVLNSGSWLVPKGYGNGRGGLVVSGNTVSASLPSNLAQPVQQAMPTNSLFPRSMIHTIDPNPTEQQTFPPISQLRYDGCTGGISMLPSPVDDGEDLLRSYLENEVMQNTPTIGMNQGMHEAVAADQISASQPQDLSDLLSWQSTNGNGTAGASGGSGVVADGIMDWDDYEIEKLFN
jgi:hypothetical protein